MNYLPLCLALGSVCPGGEHHYDGIQAASQRSNLEHDCLSQGSIFPHTAEQSRAEKPHWQSFHGCMFRSALMLSGTSLPEEADVECFPWEQILLLCTSPDTSVQEKWKRTLSGDAILKTLGMVVLVSRAVCLLRQMKASFWLHTELEAEGEVSVVLAAEAGAVPVEVAAPELLQCHFRMEYLCWIFACTDTPHGWSRSFMCYHLGARSQEPCIKDRINRWIFYYNFLKIPLLLWMFIFQVLLRAQDCWVDPGDEPGAFGCIAVLPWLDINCTDSAAWLELV
ncbi:hypothetical protein IHE44_0008033 [Lamprotornis superbus]|uniref:Uncharacterized protein n=1 Tax=Lamprotornis superbus TaxID=245042 RepID=A0A835NGH4_9PASS|nr:hypothetical protein IHE44_0008033 [Lamprotornis superbus]